MTRDYLGTAQEAGRQSLRRRRAGEGAGCGTPGASRGSLRRRRAGTGAGCGTPGADASCERRRWSRCLRTVAGSLHEEGAAMGSLGEGRTSSGSVGERVDGGWVARRGADGGSVAWREGVGCREFVWAWTRKAGRGHWVPANRGCRPPGVETVDTDAGRTYSPGCN